MESHLSIKKGRKSRKYEKDLSYIYIHEIIFIYNQNKMHREERCNEVRNCN